MTDWTLIGKNLWRKGFRTTLLLVSVVLAFLIFGTLNAFLDSFDRGAEAGLNESRLVVANKINFTQPLPYAYYQRIKALDGVKVVSHANWFGGYYKERRNQVFTFAVDPETYLAAYPDQIFLAEDQKAAFLADRSGIIIGKDFADRFGLQLGQRLPLKSDIFSNRATGGDSWDFTIRGIYTAATPQDPASGAFFHYQYFDETKSFQRDQIGTIALLPKDPANTAKIAQQIDALFANSPAETETKDEATFQRGFTEQLGDIVLIVRMVVSSAFFAILMIVGTTLILAIRERTAEIGVLKTLGFSSARVFRMVLAESMLVSLLGGGIGLGLSFVLVNFVLGPGAKAFVPSAIMMSPQLLAAGLGLAALLGVVTGAAPAANALNLRIVDALSRK